MNDNTKDWLTAIAIVTSVYGVVTVLLVIGAYYLLPH